MKRLAAVAALVLGAAVVAFVVVSALEALPRGLIWLACVLLALGAAWYGLLRGGVTRAVALVVALVALGAAVWLLIDDHDLLGAIITAGVLLLALSAGRVAFAGRHELPPAPRPERPVLIFNPRSGDGKAVRFNIAVEARERGIEAIELTPGTDLRDLVRDALANGADALAAGGGDGTQAIVAEMAVEAGLPFACIPIGTRNHFALDLGVDRDDPVGALDAFVDGGEKRVDLAEVNGQVFVNNVSLGVYAEAVQRPGYRESKLRTIMRTVPEVLGPDAQGTPLQLHDAEGNEVPPGAALLVSNDVYRLGRAIGSGTRPRLDAGVLGVAAFGARLGELRQWSVPELEVGSEGKVPMGVDGEAMEMEPPLRFRSRPGVLRVRIARSHPACSPSAHVPDGASAGVAALARIAAGRDEPVPAA